MARQCLTDWHWGWSKALKAFLERKLLGSAHVVYDGSDVLKDGAVSVLPVAEFMRCLARGDVIPA